MRKELSKEDEAKHKRIEEILQGEGYTHFYFFMFRVDSEKNTLDGQYACSESLAPVEAGIGELFREHPKAMNFFLKIIAKVVGEDRLLFHPLGIRGDA